MNCPESRFILYPSPDKCALTLETSKALEHLHDCVKCQEHFTAQVEWSRILKEKMGNDVVPERLQTQILKEIDNRLGSKPLRTLRPAWKWMFMVAALVVCLAGAWFSYWWPSRQLFRTVFEDHARYQQAQSQVNSSNSEELESWFRDKTDFGVRVPALESAQLLGGRLCFLKGRKAALVFYRKEGRTVSLFQLNGRGISLAALKQAELDGSALGRMSFKGYSLAAFEQRGVVYVVVSDLRESELLNLASAIQVKSRGY
jgi:anti-sigma factor RsiW